MSTISKQVLQRWLLLGLVWLVCACSKEGTSGGSDDQKPVRVLFRLNVPETVETKSLYDNEYRIDEIDLLVFRGGLFYSHMQGRNLQSISSGYRFDVDLIPTENAIDIIVLANARSALAAYGIPERGAAQTTVREQLTAEFATYASGSAVLFPMYAEVSLPGLSENTQLEDVKMIRALARMEVILSEDVEQIFELQTLQAYRAGDRFRLIPDLLSVSGGKVTWPSVPVTSSGILNTYTATTTVPDRITGVYLPEATASSVDQAAFLVIGGSFNGGPATFYRIDLVQNGSVGQLLRNHKYTITVTGVTGSGASTADEAASQPSFGIHTDIIEWEDDGTTTIYDGDGNHLTVSSRTLELPFYKNSLASVDIDTDIPHAIYVEWADDAGKSTGGDRYGAGMDFSNGYFKIRIADDGKAIYASALQENPNEGVRVQKILVTVSNIKLVLTIRQQTRSMRGYLNVFNLTNQAGDLGDDIFGERVTDPYYGTKLRDLIKDERNFGLYGTVPFAGFKIGGLVWQTDIVPHLIEMFDVVVIPHTNDDVVDVAESRNLSVWVNQPGKVLVTYTSNTTLLEVLGVHTGSVMQPYTYSIADDAPDEILDGPFGTISPAFTTPMLVPSVVPTISRSAHPHIRPLLVNGGPSSDAMTIGIDMQRKIVYVSDYFMFVDGFSSVTGNGEVQNDLDRLFANIWAWIAETALGDAYDPDL